MTPAFPIELPLRGEWGRTKTVNLLRDGIEFPTVRGPVFFKFKNAGTTWNSVCRKTGSCKIPALPCASGASIFSVLLTAGVTAGAFLIAARLKEPRS